MTQDEKWEPPKGFIRKIVGADLYIAKLWPRGFHCIKDWNGQFQYQPIMVENTQKELFPAIEAKIIQYVSEHSTAKELAELADAIRQDRLEFQIEYVDN